MHTSAAKAQVIKNLNAKKPKTERQEPSLIFYHFNHFEYFERAQRDKKKSQQYKQNQ